MQYNTLRPNSQLLMQPQGNGTQMPAEIQWYLDGVDINYQIILDIRNEAAIAALATNRWDVYYYNNEIYIRLYKLLGQDYTLEKYCNDIKAANTNRQTAVLQRYQSCQYEPTNGVDTRWDFDAYRTAGIFLFLLLQPHSAYLQFAPDIGTEPQDFHVEG